MQYAFHVKKLKTKQEIDSILKEVPKEGKEIKNIIPMPENGNDIVSLIENLPYYKEQGKKIRKNGVLAIYIKISMDPGSYHRLDKNDRNTFYNFVKPWFMRKFCDVYVMAECGNTLKGLVIDNALADIYAFIIPVAGDFKLNAKYYFNGPKDIHIYRDSFFNEVLSPFDLKYKKNETPIKGVERIKIMQKKLIAENFPGLPKQGNMNDAEYCKELKSYTEDLQIAVSEYIENYKQKEKEYEKALKTVNSIKYAIEHIPDRDKAENIRNSLNDAIKFAAKSRTP